MSIKRLFDSSPDLIKLAIDNGDLRALEEIQQIWGFKDKESILRFGLAILSLAKTKSIKITNEKGTDVSVMPAENLLDLKTDPHSEN